MDAKKIYFKKNYIYILILSLLAVGLLIISFQYHQKNDDTPWKQEYHADAGGYYGHLLMWFKYGYQSANYPEHSDEWFGRGFHLDSTVVKDKYTCGVAYLITPFYLGEKAITSIKGEENSVDSKPARRAVDIAGIFYLWLASILLFYFLIKYVKPIYALLSIIIVVAGTNVYSYAVHHPGMSHIYSFFLFSAFLFVTNKLQESYKVIYYVLISAISACMVLIRPTDILFLPIIFFIVQDYKKLLLFIIKPVNLLLASIVVALVFAPQCYYWYLYSGKIIYYSYGEEGFTNILSPKVIQVLFAPYNGLILYSPVIVLLLVFNIVLVVQKKRYAIYFLFYQIASLYIISSWWAPTYGQRNFVQTFAGYTLITAYIFQQLFESKKWVLLCLSILFSAVTIGLNQKIISKYNHAFTGRGIWDWQEYWYYIHNKEYIKKIDFESDQLDTDESQDARSGKHYLVVTKEMPEVVVHRYKKSDLHNLSRVTQVQYYIKADTAIVAYDVICRTKSDTGYTVIGFISNINYNLSSTSWKRVRRNMYYRTPSETSNESIYEIVFINHRNQKFKIDDLKITIR